MAHNHPVSDRPESLKETLIRRYRAGFVDKLTPQDLAELKMNLKKEFDSEGNILPEFRKRFEEKLRNYFHESVLEKEMASIEALVRELSPEDLK
jgi:DNA-binding MurR/RpiR family transcriptional regulator